MSMKVDYYEVLGVTRDAESNTIKSAYRKAALRYHPDRNPGDQVAEGKFKEASEAYEVLTDPQKKSTYDRFGHAGLSGQGFSGFQDVGDVFSSFGNIFEEFFGFSGGFGGPGGRRARRGADLRYDMAIEFKEAIFGVEKEIEFERASSCDKCSGSGAEAGGKVTCNTCNGVGQVRRSQGFFSVQSACPTCRGSGQKITKPCTSCKGKGARMEAKTINVKIPPGVDTGVRLRVTGEGESAGPGGDAGDLYVVLHVKESDLFERDGQDLIYRQKLGIGQAALGTKLTIQTIDGQHEFDVAPGTQHGERLTISGAGVPHLRGVGRGDLQIEFLIEVPKKLTKEQREILAKYSELKGEDVYAGAGGIFNKLFGD